MPGSTGMKYNVVRATKCILKNTPCKQFKLIYLSSCCMVCAHHINNNGWLVVGGWWLAL